LVEDAGVDRTRIEVIHPGCDIELFRPVPADPDLKTRLLGGRATDRVILSVGGLVPRKGHDMVIRALPEILRRCPDTTYLIVTSDRRSYGDLDKLARSVGVRERVVVAYDLPTRDLPRIYALCDVFAMPSRDRLELCDVEGFGIVFLEANACGKPVVGGRSGGIADAIVDDVTGLLVDPQDPADTARAIIRLLQDADMACRMGSRGRARVVNQFTWGLVAQRVQEVLDSVHKEKLQPVRRPSDNSLMSPGTRGPK
jgi:phosphatidylinositol alpha-1,6-mannosyltransferase